jgi:hypothetical protein
MFNVDDPAPWWTETITLACGGYAYHEEGPNSYGARCDTCFAIVGSIGMPRHCKTLLDMENVIKKLKGSK